MDPERRRRLQDERVRDPRGRCPRAARSPSSARSWPRPASSRPGHRRGRRPLAGPPHRQAGPARLRGGRPPLGRLPVHRPPPRGAPRDLHRHHRPADHHGVDPQGPLDRVRVRGPQLVAHGLPPRDDRDPRPPRLPLRRRRHAPGHLRVHGPAQHLGARRPTPTSWPSRPCGSGPGSPRTSRSWASPPGGSSRWPRKLGIPLEDAGLTGLKAPPGFGLGPRRHAPHDGGGRVLRLRGRAVRPVARGPHPRGLGRRPGGRPGHRPGGGRRRVGQPHGDHPRPGQRAAPLRPRGGLRHRARAVPVRGDLHPRAVGRPVQGPVELPGHALPAERARRRPAGHRGRASPRRSSTRWSAPTAATHRSPCGWRWRPRTPETGSRPACGSRPTSREALGVVVAVEVLDRDTIPRAGYKATRVLEP